ncbi:MAG: hypothetical protein ACI90V_006345, partial [Bacillariaceae sp.]|jgi:hypothetical protein
VVLLQVMANVSVRMDRISLIQFSFGCVRWGHELVELKSRFFIISLIQEID